MAGPDDERSSTSRQSGDESGSSPRRHGTVAVVFACATPLAVLLLPTMPAMIVTPVFATVALVSGVLARVHAKKSGGIAPGTATAIAVGAIGLCTALLLSPILGPLNTYETCLASANTVEDQSACKRTLDEGVQSRLPFATPNLVESLTE